MNNEQVGAYIRLLCYQHQFGHLSKQQVFSVTQDETVLSKFKLDENGLYFNKRMDLEIEKKQKYSESRAKNRSKSTEVENNISKTYEKDMNNICNSYEKHMENENIYINNINNNNNLEEKRVIGEKETLKVASDGSLLSETTKKVIGKLNELAGTTFRYSSKTTRSKIQARLNEGYTLDDFIVVIENKVRDWKNTNMAKYLRPETLFGNKFESYLNQKSKEITPDWFGKKIERNEATDEEMKELEKKLNKI
ncbi:MAG TPA: conserved phage C-terminal domain-containing protein [Candidatus Coprosoma intestinipullorum]|uniref:Conserved phage C-terminal domain-containing protein n=1 Tax=Candidatus Coprosoma intestinipullorum TaxID=2840752 RepID=A0A9D0ZRZ1_9FIRM|nr:conserved phage C-terminal domain-containing protein [Candidatus Coprosoma intestinipullorum]